MPRPAWLAGSAWIGAALGLSGLLILAAPAAAGPLINLQAGRSEEPLAVAAEGGNLQLRPGQVGTIELGLRIPPGFTVYQDMIRVNVADARGLRLGAAVLPPGRKVPDPAADPALGPVSMREVYEQDIVIGLPLLAAPPTGSVAVPVELRFQACRGSVCLFPQTETVFAVVQVSSSPPAGAPQAGQ